MFAGGAVVFAGGTGMFAGGTVANNTHRSFARLVRKNPGTSLMVRCFGFTATDAPPYSAE